MSYLRYSIRPTFQTSDVLNDNPSPDLSHPENLVKYWREHVESDHTIDSYKENVLVVAVDARIKAIGHHLVSVGSNDQCMLAIPEVLRPVILAGTNRFILVHNHPSGEPSPSSLDIRVTQKLMNACETMDMRLVDHVIIGSKGIHSYYSFRENGGI